MGPRAIPAGRHAAIAFSVDADPKVVHVLNITYAGADWITRVDLRRQ